MPEIYVVRNQHSAFSGATIVPDLDATHCAMDYCGLYQQQEDGDEPGRTVGGEWFCAACLGKLRSGEWLREMRDLDYCLEVLDEHPALVDWLMEDTDET